MKKALLLFVVLALVFAPIFAEGAKEKKEDGPITIELWTHEDAARQELEDRYIAEFCETHPNVTVNVTRQSAEKLRELVQTAFAAGQGPTVFNLSIEDERQYIEAGLVQPINYAAAGYKDAKDVIANYMDNMLDGVTFEGEVYGLPIELTNWSILVNTKVLKSAGLTVDDLPKTWEEMMALCEKLVIRDGDVLKRRGFDFRYTYELTYFVPMVEQLGGELVSADGKTACVGEEAWIKALTFMQEWGPNGKNLGAPTYTAARKLFNKDNNDITMCNTGLYQESRILSENPDFYNSGEWMFIPYPVFEGGKDIAGCYYGHYYLVNSNVDDATSKVAWELISYMLSHGEEYLEHVGLIQPSLKLMNSDIYKNMPYSDVISSDFARGHIVYYGYGSAQIQTLINSAIKSVMLSGVTPADAYKTLKAAVQEILDEQ
ncbi:MAG: extracellular solute-binding protein [Sphaerochaetaceae bacterium]|nr:extracellular solute-binding protein [Sphaerochaetaceae bacterium]